MLLPWYGLVLVLVQSNNVSCQVVCLHSPFSPGRTLFLQHILQGLSCLSGNMGTTIANSEDSITVEELATVCVYRISLVCVLKTPHSASTVEL